ncbi:M-phase-specific PLK1-interacting protein [Symphorus nematophorus]
MYRTPLRPQRSPAPGPGPPRVSRFPSPPSCWGFSGSGPPRSPYGGSPRAGSPFSPGSPLYSPGQGPGPGPGPYRGFRDGSQTGSPSRGSRGHMRGRRGSGFRRPQSFSPGSAQNLQSDSVERYFSPSMLQDPWASLQPVSVADRQTTAS